MDPLLRSRRAGIRSVVAAALASIPLRGACQAPAASPLQDFLNRATQALAERQKQFVPRGGHWVVVYRERGSAATSEVVLWDSAEPDKYAQNPWAVPCWLRLVITVRAEGLVDGRGVPYNGPLLAKTSGDCALAGPYPEGFVYVADGGFELTVAPRFEPFMQTQITVTLCYREAPAFVEIDGRPWPPTSDYFLGTPIVDEPLWGRTVRFAGASTRGDEGFRMSPVRTEVLGGQRVIFAEAQFAMEGGKPAAELPVRFEWALPGEEGAMDTETHEGLTDNQGRAVDTIQVPANVDKGSIRFWYRDNGEEYGPASGQKFDFGAPNEDEN